VRQTHRSPLAEREGYRKRPRIGEPGVLATEVLSGFPQGEFMERAIEFLAAIQCLVIGLSHVAQPRGWVEFFVWLRGKGHAGVFANGFLSLWFGSVIVAFHNTWEGLPAVLTFLGWAQVFKAFVNFVLPQVAMRGLARVSPERAREFVAAGVVLLALSGLLWFVVLTR
jgi:hypothetical protein